MSRFLNEEKSAHRKWVNVIASALLPGLGHFLSNRRVAAISWFLASSAIGAIGTFLFLLPYTKSILPAIVIWSLRLLLWLVIMIDSCRKPIPRLGFCAWAGACLAIIVLPVVFVLPRMMSFKSFSVPTSTMMPTLMGNRKSSEGQTLKGDSVIVNLWSYRRHSPRRGDVIVFDTEAIAASARERFHVPLNDLYVKRVVGLPGERVSIKPPSIFVNGTKVVEPKILENLFSKTNAPGLSAETLGGQGNEVQLGADEYYVVGDNVLNSLDSRYFGPIKSGHFVGKVLGVFWPIDRRGFVE